MATINISITDYLVGCSLEEKKELCAALVKVGIIGIPENSDEFPQINENSDNSYLLEKLFSGNIEEATEEMLQITGKWRIPFAVILMLMPHFKKLENIRLKSLVKPAQEIKE